MADEIDIDNILEDDMLNALEELGTGELSSTELINTNNNNEKAIEDNKNKIINIDSSNINDITNILKELLNNKTLEITIKLKDN